jgi:antitoxin component of RelBE/YafQ-DinJ toxin-antitoxin module
MARNSFGRARAMPDKAVVRARMDERTKREAAAEKALPFEPLNPNAETVAAMKAARRGELVKSRTNCCKVRMREIK